MIPKFRAWDKRFSEFVEDFFVSETGKIYKKSTDTGYGIAISRETSDKVILMCSTGLCDKVGTEVFEGDILRHQIQTDYTFIVKYDKDNGRWSGDSLSRTYRIDLMKHFMQYYKVIGNIYENPDSKKQWIERTVDDYGGVEDVTERV